MFRVKALYKLTTVYLYTFITFAKSFARQLAKWHVLQANEVIRVHWLTKIVLTDILNAGDNSTAPGEDGTVTPDGSTPAPDEAPGRRRRRRAAADSHNVELVAVDPPVKDGRLRTAVVASDPGQKYKTPCLSPGRDISTALTHSQF